MATDAKQSGEDVPAVGRPSTAPATPPLPVDPRPGQVPDLAMLHRKARVALEEVLVPDEEPRLLIPGLASSAIVATDRRAFVFKTGARAGLPVGARLKPFEYETVMRVDLRRGADCDVVVIHAPLKISTCSSYWADSRDDPWKARNAIAVTHGSKRPSRRSAELLRELVRNVNDRHAASRAEHSPQAPGSADRTPDVVGRIAELEQRGARAEIASVPGGADPQPIGECSRCGTSSAPAGSSALVAEHPRRPSGAGIAPAPPPVLRKPQTSP